MKKEEIIKKQAAEQAPPVNVSFVTKALEAANRAKEAEPEEEDAVLAKGIDSDFWQVLKKKIKGRIKKMEELLNEPGRFDLEEIGIRYLLQDQAVSAYKDIISIVETTAKVLETIKKEEQEKKKEESK